MDPVFWRGRRVLITGGTGMIGAQMAERLYPTGAVLTIASLSGRAGMKNRALREDSSIVYRTGDLRDSDFASACTAGQDMVLHFASRKAGLGYNEKRPAEMMSYNIILDTQTVEASARNKVGLFFCPSGALVYDENVEVPISEAGSTQGEPVPACKGAAWAKRAFEIALRYYTEETGMKGITVRFSNIYGPGDDFLPQSSHLIGNLIRLISNGEAPEVWGDGSQLRAYLYVTDAVEAALRLIELGTEPGPINVGSQVEHSVMDIIGMLGEISGRKRAPIFHPAKPRGLDRKLLDTSKFTQLTGFKESVPLRQGLEWTYQWYVSVTKGTALSPDAEA